MNVFVIPLAIVASVGVIAMDTNSVGVIVRIVDPEILPDSAIIVAVPAVTEVAKPFNPAALLIAAIPESDELQVTALVKFCVVLSE